MNWYGVMPAMTTAFTEDLKVDHKFLARHAAWLLGTGCTGLVMLGSLGEGATLTHEEKVAILKTAVSVAGDKPVVAAISALSTEAAVALAKDAEAAGCSGLMVLPPYVYTSDWREMKAHVVAILKATKLSCMLYNNPIAYKTDFLPDQIAELAAEYPNLAAVKESSADVRRVSWIKALLGDRLKIFVGVDDALVEGVAAGATGWVAGLVNAYPAESVELFNLAIAGKTKEAFELYKWFLPLLRMDTVPKFVQLIKWVQEQAGVGSQVVRAPRLVITGAELEEATATYKTAVAARPKVEEKPLSSF
ncbi:dihydrodipicolinate synthase family protein [Silvibacterium dinghuense]|uniref:Dihydrodipicolinate synthase family protein n=1 Tax=Silvibacterium dinghuense TaxID=1560006 RepID=A0A4Q1SIR2_9BACT|nr:dihydrodipicolinate synthase family protein [Silvibacterium dinghuense]RXS97289.1 dihydrodipicolinate synthase family protein [Silvibacterium dinghuense]GGG97808.1 dihydrodipicolinate synthase family protein [Silvibacterium dinghuense]